ncbi:MAG: hypothetical protein SRB2_03798 [Desulfobacteraceae bacterium Eth-SRB2]|nr:MAG: hypothetical protein SRB2_03798 [Desulfobacteraceae bacterium Eth-SRB2]
MGTGHSIDTPIRVAPLGISSVISLVDDLLLEKIRKYYTSKFNLPYVKIPRNAENGRAKRITAYLDTVYEIVGKKMEETRNQPFFKNNNKRKYFELLPEESLLRKKYEELLKMKPGHERDALEKDLTSRMKPGSIDVNIMVTVDRAHFDKNGNPLGDEFSDAQAGLRGYANSCLESGIVYSAGFNRRLFSYMTRFKDFYRDKMGRIKKRIILKVSDFRSALVQGKFLAKKGLEVHEFRIESGLNCGGHVFASNGILLPVLLEEFKEKGKSLMSEFQPLIQKYYKKMGWDYPESELNDRPLITVQGGIGTHGEVRRLEEFNIDRTGWASPFLLVPEVTRVDATTRELLRQAQGDDLYMSDVSPLGIPFNNVHNTGSEIWTQKKVAEGRPGSTCPKHILVSNTEYTEKPICLASRRYQKIKLKEIDKMNISADEKARLCKKVGEKTCICDHLANGALIALGIAEEKKSPQSICPGPNIEWFCKFYTLKEMVDHIYGRGPSLVSSKRPHMFAKEIVMYVEYFEKMVADSSLRTAAIKALLEFKNNLEAGLDFCLEIAHKEPYPEENLASISVVVERERVRLRSISNGLEEKLN